MRGQERNDKPKNAIEKRSTLHLGTIEQQPDFKETPEGTRLITAVKNILSNNDAEQIKAHHPGKRTRKNDVRFITVDTPKEDSQAFVSAINQIAIDPETELTCATVEGTRLDKRTGKSISFCFIDYKNEQEFLLYAYDRVDDLLIEIWEESGGPGYVDGQVRPITKDELTELTEQLESAKPNKTMTNKALTYFIEHCEGEKIVSIETLPEEQH